jgi:cytochrome oxidase Cu insertion factor (SCO1/SenC/PrrC family)
MLQRLAVTQALVASFLAAPAAQAPAPVDPAALGPQVGERARPFTLPDQTGARRALASLAGPNGTMLVFFRSSDW